LSIYDSFKYNNKFDQIIEYVSRVILRITNKKDGIEKSQGI